MRNKVILITGGAGFIGSHLVSYLLSKYDYYIINLDALTYAGDLNRLKAIEEHPNYKFIYGNICDQDLVNQLFKEYNINSVIHLAAESHVDNSIARPSVFIETNVKGTFNLLEAARKYWFLASNQFLSEYKDAKFLHVSTDEVYGTLKENGYFSEITPYAPNSPYSASKAASDFLVRSYVHTYGMPALISNCSNNYGPKQHDEKLIPTVIRKALSGEPIPIYGNGKNIRDWLYVLDHCIALDDIFHKGRIGESYNVGTNNERTNIEIASHICQLLDKLHPASDGNSYLNQITYVADRAGHDFRYAIDNTKITKELGWQPSYSYELALEDTVKWYVNYYATR